MKIEMLDGRTIDRASVIVIDQIEYMSQQCPVGLIRYDGGRYMRVMFFEGRWIDHLTDWRIYDTIAEAKRFSSEIAQSDIEVADELARLQYDDGDPMTSFWGTNV